MSDARSRRVRIDPSSPRLRAAAILVAALLTAAVPALWFGWKAVADVTDEIEAGRLRLAQLAATQADRVVAEAFYEIELMAQGVSADGMAGSLPLAADALREIHGRGGSFHSGVVLLDAHGGRVAAAPALSFGGSEVAAALREASQAPDRLVSKPWLDPTSAHAMAALSIPLYGADGTRIATVVGIMDLAEPLISDLVVPAARLGPSGHADLVDERGIVLASTDPGHVLTAGDHPDFYAAAAIARTAMVARAVHDHDAQSVDRSAFHIMAYAPLQNAPWGVAMGADERETFEPIRRLQRRLLAAGTASVAVLLLGAGLVVRRLPRLDGR